MKLILIHGQGRTPFSMMLLGWRLRQQGYKVIYFGYVSFIEKFAGITQRFVGLIREKIKAEPYAIVSHSMGGLVARASLPHLSDNLPRHMVMLAPPNQPALLAKRARRNPLYAWVTGDCGQKLADDTFYKTLSGPTGPTTIIAGSWGPRGKLSPFGDNLNDCVLSLEETKIEPDDQVVVIKAAHALIMHSRDVARIIHAVVGLT